MMIYNTISVFQRQENIEHVKKRKANLSHFQLSDILPSPWVHKQNNADDRKRVVITDCWYEICAEWSFTQTTIHRVVFSLFVLLFSAHPHVFFPLINKVLTLIFCSSFIWHHLLQWRKRQQLSADHWCCKKKNHKNYLVRSCELCSTFCLLLSSCAMTDLNPFN